MQIPTLTPISLETALINTDLFLKCCLCEIKTAHQPIIADIIYGKSLTPSCIENGNSIQNPAVYTDNFQISAAI
jgi:hypothetical protein